MVLNKQLLRILYYLFVKSNDFAYNGYILPLKNKIFGGNSYESNKTINVCKHDCRFTFSGMSKPRG